MPEFVNQLDRRKENDQQKPVGGQHGGSGRAGEFMPVRRRLKRRRDQEDQPNDDNRRRGGPVQPGADFSQKRIRISEWNFQEQDFLDEALRFLLFLIGGMFLATPVLAGPFGLQQLMVDRPPEQTLGLPFIQCVPTHRAGAGSEGFAKRPFAVKCLKETKFRGTNLEILPGGDILKNVAGPAAGLMKGELEFFAQSWTSRRQFRDRMVGPNRFNVFSGICHERSQLEPDEINRLVKENPSERTDATGNPGITPHSGPEISIGIFHRCQTDEDVLSVFDLGDRVDFFEDRLVFFRG